MNGKKNTVATLLNMKKSGEKVSMLTCYDYTTARIMENAGINTILVGDSLGMTMQGYDTTLPVTMDETVIYTRSVVRGCSNTFVIADMPFMSYQISAAQAVENAGRLIKETGANAVKLEGGAAVTEQIRAIVNAGIPVCAHIGMTPQSVNVFGGFKVQGKGEANAKRVLEDAFEVQQAGAFMCVLECVPIGIGAGAGCDGQVLVMQDMLAMNTDFTPKFVKPFADIGQQMSEAFKAYDSEVKANTFPDAAHSFSKSDCSDEYLAQLDEVFK